MCQNDEKIDKLFTQHVKNMESPTISFLTRKEMVVYLLMCSEAEDDAIARSTGIGISSLSGLYNNITQKLLGAAYVQGARRVNLLKVFKQAIERGDLTLKCIEDIQSKVTMEAVDTLLPVIEQQKKKAQGK